MTSAFHSFLFIFLWAIVRGNNWRLSNKATEFPTKKIATLNIVPSSESSPDANVNHNIVFPKYLNNLRDVTPNSKWELAGCGPTFTEDPINVEQTIDLGDTLEMDIRDGMSHPPHIHVNHVQVMNDSPESLPMKWILDFQAVFDPEPRTQFWYKSGEWYDNLAADRTVRMPAVDFSGPYTFHCHWLQHEDLGCMGVIQVNGNDPERNRTYFEADPSVRDTFETEKVDYSHAGMYLKQPDQVSWENFQDGAIETTLYLDTLYYNGVDAQYATRGYNGNIPGPTLRLKRGTTVKVSVHNLLADNDGAKVLNYIGAPNTTNLHTHGLHISPHAPGDDNIRTKVDPGMAVTYTYEIPTDHLGGTHWYHPHYHGSTSLQTGGGAMGMIIVDDEDSDNIPQWIRDAEEIQLVATVMPQTLDDVAWLETMAGGHLPHPTADSEFLLLNGMYEPIINMTQNKWYRWRWVTGTINYFVWVELKNNDCEFYLLATDGVYLPDGLRKIDYLAGSSGNRADILVRCSTPGRSDLGTVNLPEFTRWYSIWWVWVTFFVLFILLCCICTGCFYCCRYIYKLQAKGETGIKKWEDEEIEFAEKDSFDERL